MAHVADGAQLAPLVIDEVPLGAWMTRRAFTRLDELVGLGVRCDGRRGRPARGRVDMALRA